MLRHLSIKNYTLIDSLEIDFPSGFITVTGETGAGKSVILGAIGLISGGRAESKMLRQSDKKAVIEALFDTIDTPLQSFLECNGIDHDPDGIIIRREISPGGRSRAFINDTPVSVQILSDVASRLIDIHSQHQNILLADPVMQRDIIDSFANSQEALTECRKCYKEYTSIRSKIQQIRKAQQSLAEKRQILEFRAARLNRLNLRRGELKELEDSLELLSDSENIRSHLSSAYYAVEGSDSSVVSMIVSALNDLGSINSSAIQEIREADIIKRLQMAAIEVKDIAETLRHVSASIDVSPDRLQKVESRISSIYATAKDLCVVDPEELVDMKEETEKSLVLIQEASPEIIGMEAEAQAALTRLREAASRLTEVRTKAAEGFTALLTDTARPLGLNNLRFEVDIQKGKIGPEGQDVITFKSAFNKNQEPMPIARTASGGEISRLMLSVKAIVADRFRVPTIIFDEIDSGVSGETASRMAALMRSLGDRIQVIAVTHLPQVAARGSSQFKVYKTDGNAYTTTEMRLLDYEQRVEAIAAMLSGSEVQEAALLNARSLLNDN